MRNEEKLTQALAQGHSIAEMLDELPVEELRRLANLPDESGFEAPAHRMITSPAAMSAEKLKCAACPHEFTISDDERRFFAIGNAPKPRFCRDCRWKYRNEMRTQ